MAEYVQSRPLQQGRVGVLASAFNPPTIAHVALAEAARSVAGLAQVAFTLARRLPHKEYEDAPFEQRLRLLRELSATRPEWACVVTNGGLFLEMALEIKAVSGAGVETLLLCGRDAAERIVGWDYGDGPPIEQQLQEYGMVVAARAGEYAPPESIAGELFRVSLPDFCDDVSSSAVRAAVRDGGSWREMVPAAVAGPMAEMQLYRR